MAEAPKETILETLAETRVSVLYLQRVAAERKDKASADMLAVQGAELKGRIAELRRAAYADWRKTAGGIQEKFAAAQDKLEALVKEIEKDEKVVGGVVKAVKVVDDLLALAGKVLP